MICFDDRNGNKWTLDLNIGSARRVKAETGIDLVNSITVDNSGINTSVLEMLSDDPYKLVSVIYSLCAPQISQKGFTEEQFAEGFDADVIQNAIDALLQEIINFSQPAKKKMLMVIFQKTRDFREKAEQHLDDLMKSEEFNKEIENQLNSLLTNTQES